MIAGVDHPGAVREVGVLQAGKQFPHVFIEEAAEAKVSSQTPPQLVWGVEKFVIDETACIIPQIGVAGAVRAFIKLWGRQSRIIVIAIEMLWRRCKRKMRTDE